MSSAFSSQPASGSGAEVIATVSGGPNREQEEVVDETRERVTRGAVLRLDEDQQPNGTDLARTGGERVGFEVKAVTAQPENGRSSAGLELGGNGVSAAVPLPTQEMLRGLGAELAFVQTTEGDYGAFYWREAHAQGLDDKAIIASSIDANPFGPVGVPEYLEQLQRIAGQAIPERFSCRFTWHGQQRLFDLVVSPVLGTDGQTRHLLVLGRSLPTKTLSNGQLSEVPVPTAVPYLPSGLEAHQKLLSKIARSIRRTLPLSSALYQILLTRIARNIRRTLDRETIWQQTVEGLGQALSVSRCLICGYGESGNTESAHNAESAHMMPVLAEFCQENYPALLGQMLPVLPDAELQQAIASLEPIAIEQCAPNAFQVQSMIVVATRYQDHPNALICLHQCDRIRHWSSAEIELVRELADQVGTAIAHASLFSESQALANELQQANIRLVQKHQELEEARQQAEEVSRLKSEFLANTSHEIRTPLNGVIGFLKLITDGMVDDPEEQQEFIEEAYRSAVHLLDILNDILDIARIEADKMELNLGPVNLSELLINTGNFTHAQVQQKNLYFEVEMPETHDEIIVYGDYQRLLQVLLNLTGNAIKFTHTGGITISTEIIRKKAIVQNKELPGLVRVRVADTGIGVSLDKQDKLFQSFSQVDGSRTRRYGGTGLGLVISQKLVEAMGGTVNFYSLGEDLGSTVTFTVPLYQEPVIVTKKAGS
jgi:signal transduction histidine kinase